MADAERQEKENELIAEKLNEEQFRAPIIEVRRSVRTNKGIAPVRYSDNREKNEWDDFNEISNKCNVEHKGINCADKRANHAPDYFNSASIVKNS